MSSLSSKLDLPDDFICGDCIGAGAMGRVFAAECRGSNEQFAIKVFEPKGNGDLATRERFEQEIATLSLLQQRGIPQLLHSDTAHEPPYYVMTRIDGHSLGQVIRQARAVGEPIPLEAATFMMRQLVEICDYALSQNILHRDLKLDNCLVDALGNVHLIDWGLAAPVGESGGMTEEREVAAYVNCMAPERALGEPATVVSEIYALGVIFYTLVSLRPPFMRRDFKHYKTMMGSETWIPAHERNILCAVPLELSALLDRCLSPDPTQRPQSFSDLADKLR